MARYARVENGVVVEVIGPPEGVSIAEMFHPDLARQFGEVGADVTQGWIWDGKTLSPPAPVVPAPPAATD